MENLERASMQLILHSGNARSCAFEALHAVKDARKNEGLERITTAKKELLCAQKQHAQLLRSFANEEAVPLDLLLVHAEDHISSSQVVVELIDEMMQMYERFGEQQ